MKNYIYWIAVLIGIYLIADNAVNINKLSSTVGTTILKGIATLQGRSVPGVTK